MIKLRDDGLQAGCAVVDITPPVGLCLAGHFNRRPSVGTHDPLTAQALAVRQGGATVAMVGTDLIEVTAEITAAVRRQVADRTGLPPEHLMIWATHTHAGPVLEGDDGDEEYAAYLVAALAGAGEAALAGLRPATLRLGRGHEARIAHNRRYRLKDGSVRTNPGVGNPEVARIDGPMDPEVGVLVVDFADGPGAILVNYACHLDVLGNGNFLYSADYPWAMREVLQGVYGPQLVVPFANGACGNINHIDVFGTRRQGGYDLSQMMGRMLAGEVMKVEPWAEELNVDRVGGRSRLVELPRRPYSEAELTEFRATLTDERIGETAYARVRARTHLALHERGAAAEAVEVQVLRLGDLALIGIPAEYFVEYGLQLKAESPIPHTFVVELANGCIGYVPTPEGFDEGGYEGTSARFTREAGPLLARAALELLGD